MKRLRLNKYALLIIILVIIITVIFYNKNSEQFQATTCRTQRYTGCMTDRECKDATYHPIGKLGYDPIRRDDISKYCLKRCKLIWPGSTETTDGYKCRKTNGTIVDRTSYSKCCPTQR